MNEVSLMGRLTKDPEITSVGEKSISKATFSLAIDRAGKKGEADFPRVVAWGSLAENIAKYVGKGCRLVIVGHIQTGNYKDKNGNNVYTTDVIADKATFIDFKGGAESEESKGNPAGANKGDVSDSDVW